MVRHEDPGFGATGQFPEGKLNDDDQGELRYGVAHDKGHVLVNFGKPVAFLGMPPANARELAMVLLEKANDAERYLERRRG